MAAGQIKASGLPLRLQIFLLLNTKALLGLALALILPFLGYFLVSHYSKDALHMPRKYFMDSVSVTEVRGRQTTDTVWHSVKNFSFTNQFGEKKSLDDARGKIIVMDFFFTRCPLICPNMTRAMLKLEKSFPGMADKVQFISVSIDPEHDSAVYLRKFADRFGANQDNWWFVSGDKKETYDFAIKEMKANIADPGVDSAFIHTEHFFLLDTNRVVRGFYNAFDTLKQAQLAKDIPTLMLEKGRASKSPFRGFIPLLPLLLGGIVAAAIILYFVKKKQI